MSRRDGFDSSLDEDGFVGWVRKWWLACVSVICALFLMAFAGQILEWNADEDLQVCEYPWGEARFVNSAGMYLQLFGNVTTYPRNIDMSLDAEVDPKNPSTIRVTFSDAGNGWTSHALKITLPSDETRFFAMHRNFGATGVEGIKHAVFQHLATALKNTGPMMTASEFQMQSQQMFYATVRDQLEKALYQFETIEQTVRRKVDEKTAKQLHQFSGGEEDTVVTTRVKIDPKTQKPVTIADSPLLEYGFTIVQYSMTETEFDPDTKAQIDKRRDAYQLAEQMKASVTKANQETLQAVEAGKAAVAKVEAEAKKDLRQKVIAAEQEVGVATEAQKQAVNVAEQTLATAEQAKLEAQQLFVNSKIELQKAEAAAAKTLAEAMAKKAGLEQGGALAAVTQLRAEEAAKRRTALAGGAAKMPSPKNLIVVPKKDGAGGSGGIEALMQMWMMRQSGMVPTAPQQSVPKAAPANQ